MHLFFFRQLKHFPQWASYFFVEQQLQAFILKSRGTKSCNDSEGNTHWCDEARMTPDWRSLLQDANSQIKLRKIANRWIWLRLHIVFAVTRPHICGFTSDRCGRIFWIPAVKQWWEKVSGCFFSRRGEHEQRWWWCSGWRETWICFRLFYL